MISDIKDILGTYSPIGLEQMGKVKLMNRTDTKYVLSVSVLPTLLSAAKEHYDVQTIDGLRVAQYNTLYYDTDTLDMYLRHHNRQLIRQKIRVRQYVESALTFLEIKRKTNNGRTKKKRVQVSNFDITPQTIGHGKIDMPVEEFVGTYSDYRLDGIYPHLRTLFNRITLVNKARTERLTIDMNLQWENIRTGQQAAVEDLVIIEIKREGNSHSAMAQILQQQRIKPLKMSKYCIGTILTTPAIKHNRFKGKWRKITKVLQNKQTKNQ